MSWAGQQVEGLQDLHLPQLDREHAMQLLAETALPSMLHDCAHLLHILNATATMHSVLMAGASATTGFSPLLPLTTLRRLMLSPPLSLPDSSSLSLKLASVSGGLVTLDAGVDMRVLETAWLLLAPP